MNKRDPKALHAERERLSRAPRRYVERQSHAKQIEEIERACSPNPLDIRHWYMMDWVLIIATTLVIIGIAQGVPADLIEWLSTHAPGLPPSVDGRRWLFALTLGGIIATSALCSAILIDNVRVIRSDRGAKLRNQVASGPGWRHPAILVLIIESLYLLAMLCAVAPDGFVLLLYGEQSDRSREVLLAIDRFLDFTVFLFVIAAFILRARAGPSIAFQLTKEPLPVDLWPTWFMVRDKLYMVVLSLVIAVGVALGK